MPCRRRIALASLLVLSTCAGEARAKDGKTTASEGVRDDAPQERWYGWQTLLVDGASVGAFIGGRVKEPPWISPALLGAAATGWVLGPPVIHLEHRHLGKAAGDFALRLGPPLAIAGTAAACGGKCDDVSARLAMIEVLGLIGVVLATPFIDAFVLSWERQDRRNRTTFWWQPRVSIRPGGGEIGVTGCLF